jgi:hypothetical protein
MSKRLLALQTSTKASENFSFNAAALPTTMGKSVGMPLFPFMFYVRFVPNSDTGEKAWEQGVSKAIKSVGSFSADIQTERMNQYNKSRIVQKRLEWSDISMNFHDTSDGCVRNMWYDYYSHYYGDPFFPESEWGYDILTRDMLKTPYPGSIKQDFGYNPPKNLNDKGSPDILNSAYFFKRIEIYKFFGQVYSQYDLINPRIVKYNTSELNYAGEESANIEMTFSFETFKVITENRQTNKDEFIKNISKNSAGKIFNPPLESSPVSLWNATLPFGGGRISTKIMNKIPVLKNQTIINAGRRLNQLGELVNPEFQNGILGTFGGFDFGELASGTKTAIGWADPTDPNMMSQATKLSSAISNISQSVAETAATAAEAISKTGIASSLDVASQVISKSIGIPLTGAMNLLSDTSTKFGMKLVDSKTKTPTDFGL